LKSAGKPEPDTGTPGAPLSDQPAPRASQPEVSPEDALSTTGGVFFNVGRIQSPFGLKGELNVAPLTDYPERWEELQEVWMLAGRERIHLRIKSVRLHAGRALVCFTDYESRTAVEGWNGRYLQIPRADARPLPPGAYWMADLVGLSIVTGEGQVVGTVREVLQAGNDLLEVVTPTGQELLIPMVKEFVKHIDLERRQIVIEPIPGLLE